MVFMIVVGRHPTRFNGRRIPELLGKVEFSTATSTFCFVHFTTVQSSMTRLEQKNK